MNLSGIRFPGGIDVCKDDMVCVGKGFGKIPQQGFGPCVGVGLEDAPDFPVWIILRRRQGGFDFCRMVGIVVNDGDAVNDALIFEAAVRSLKIGQTQFDFSIGMFSSMAAAMAAREFETLCIPVTLSVICSSFSPLAYKS